MRVRYTLLAKKFKRREADEETASGIAPSELSETDKLLEELIEKFTVGDMQTSEKNDKKDQDRTKGVEMRKRSMEKLGETSKRKRENDEEGETPNRKRATGTEAIMYLKEKGERELAIKTEELGIRKKENELREKMQDTAFKQQQEAQQHMSKLLCQMQQQLQQQQQQQQQQLQYQQQQHMLQTKLLMTLVEKSTNNNYVQNSFFLQKYTFIYCM